MAAKYLLYQQTLLNGLPLVGGPTVQSILDARAAEGYRVHTLGPWTLTLIQILFAKDEPLLAPAPVVNVAAPNVNVAAPNVAAPTVNVASPTVNVDAPVVHVAAPEVSVEAPVVHVAAPQVSVDAPIINVDAPQVTVKMPEVPAPPVNVNTITQPARTMRSTPVLKQGPRPE